MAYGLLSAAFTGVYVAIVVGLGAVARRGGGPVLTIAAAICIAVLFQPLRQRFRRFANRLVYGERATPYQVLSDFAEDMAGQLDFTEAVDRMVAVLAGATGGGPGRGVDQGRRAAPPGRGLAARVRAAAARRAWPGWRAAAVRAGVTRGAGPVRR